MSEPRDNTPSMFPRPRLVKAPSARAVRVLVIEQGLEMMRTFVAINDPDQRRALIEAAQSIAAKERDSGDAENE